MGGGHTERTLICSLSAHDWPTGDQAHHTLFKKRGISLLFILRSDKAPARIANYRGRRAVNTSIAPSTPIALCLSKLPFDSPILAVHHASAMTGAAQRWSSLDLTP